MFGFKIIDLTLKFDFHCHVFEIPGIILGFHVALQILGLVE